MPPPIVVEDLEQMRPADNCDVDDADVRNQFVRNHLESDTNLLSE